MNGLITAAIAQRRLLKLHYSAGNRIVEPHIYGVDGGDKALLRGYQIGGESASRERYGWKLLREADILNVEVLDVRFEPRPDFKPDDPAIHRVYARVA